jgi:hypothetical protein
MRILSRPLNLALPCFFLLALLMVFDPPVGDRGSNGAVSSRLALAAQNAAKANVMNVIQFARLAAACDRLDASPLTAGVYAAAGMETVAGGEMPLMIQAFSDNSSAARFFPMERAFFDRLNTADLQIRFTSSVTVSTGPPVGTQTLYSAAEKQY